MHVLGASYGMALRNPVVQLPEGLTAVHPKVLDNIPAGTESIVVARMQHSKIKGEIKLLGKVGGEKFEQTYPIELVATTSKGNAFVPRLYAATKIQGLESESKWDGARPNLWTCPKSSRWTAVIRAFGS